MARPPLTVVGYIHLNDGRTVPVDEMTTEERERVKSSMERRLSRVMSEYYRLHPDEFEKIS